MGLENLGKGGLGDRKDYFFHDKPLEKAYFSIAQVMKVELT